MFFNLPASQNRSFLSADTLAGCGPELVSVVSRHRALLVSLNSYTLHARQAGAVEWPRCYGQTISAMLSSVEGTKCTPHYSILPACGGLKMEETFFIRRHGLIDVEGSYLGKL